MFVLTRKDANMHHKLAFITFAAITAASAHAADGVSFYALIDGGIAHSSIRGVGSKTEFVTGGYAPTFAGLKGEKSLGDGFTGGFNLEQGFLLSGPNNAAGNGYATNSRYAFGDDAVFNRQANLYIKGSSGTFKAGTQDDIAFSSVVSFDPRLGSSYGSALAAVVAQGGLHSTADNNALSYTSPTFSGFKAAVEYVYGSPTSGISNITSGHRLALNYDSGKGFKGTVASYKDSDDTAGTASKASSGYVLGASQKLGDFELKALYVNQTSNLYDFVANTSTHMDGLATTGLGGTYTLNAKTVIDFGTYTSSKDAYKMKTTGVGVQYEFLKDLKIYGQYASVKNDGTIVNVYNFTPTNDTKFTGAITSGQTANTLNVGLLYAFF